MAPASLDTDSQTRPAREFFATCAKGLEDLLATELRACGAVQVRETRAGVSFAGSLETGLRVCLWSRLASRILLPIGSFPAATPEELYAGTRLLPWSEHLTPDHTLAVSCQVTESEIGHSHFAALTVKDAIVDLFRDQAGMRPSVAVLRPDLQINVHLRRNQAVVSIDLAGESLHRRGYRQDGLEAPLKENLAAAVLLRAGWPAIAEAGGPLLDPMCGSGTLVIEAALMAADIAPGLERAYFGFQGWQQFEAPTWEVLLAEARQRRTNGLEHLPALVGYDASVQSIKAAWVNAGRIGLQDRVHFERRELAAAGRFPGRQPRPGLVVVNPPYGERLGAVEELRPLYAHLGGWLKSNYQGWQAAVITANQELGKALGLKAHRLHTLYNGALKCRLLHFVIDPEKFGRPAATTMPAAPPALSPGAAMLANRLRKNLRTIGRWARQQEIDCYRLYDADLPEYAVAVDVYQQWAHVQEYAPPAGIDPEKARQRRSEVLAAVPAVLGIPAGQVYYKLRRRQPGPAQYEKLAQVGGFHEVREGSCRFLVNFTDYLDCGLFLDHRPTRALIGELARGRSFLNLFGYTGTATVCAAVGGARSTVTVDMSNTYLAWARRNLAANGFSFERHTFVRADCLAWLQGQKMRFDLIFLDPPTFSNSKKMGDRTFDVQRDHVVLVRAAAALLSPGGVLLFANNRQGFVMAEAALGDFILEEITRQTIPKDFARQPHAHACWRISRR